MRWGIILVLMASKKLMKNTLEVQKELSMFLWIQNKKLLEDIKMEKQINLLKKDMI